VATCYRLEHFKNYLRSWSLRGSNDLTLPLDQWTILDRRCEEHAGQLSDLSLFGCIGGVFRYFRFVMEGTGWDGTLRLFIKHIELYGSLISPV
jgi:hypothetical protein